MIGGTHDRDRGKRPGRRGQARGGVCFVAWGAVAGRSAEIAAALDGRALCLYPPGAGSRPHVALRYLVSAVRTADFVLRERPSVLIVTNPPVIAPAVCLLMARLVGSRLVLDSHPGSFGALGDRNSARLQGVQRFLTRRADLSLVAAPCWKSLVESWGGAALVVHEAPACAPQGGEQPNRASGRFSALCVGRLAPDEPTAAVVAAAALVPEVDFLVTGDPARCPEMARSAPANCRFVGFLGPSEYRRTLSESGVVLSLTTDDGSVMRSAYEAVYAERPLIVSDGPLAGELFPHAITTQNDAASIAAAVRAAANRPWELHAVAGAARRLQLERWEAQLAAVRSHIGSPSPTAR